MIYKISKKLFLTLAFSIIFASYSYAQIDYRWLNVGSFHNFYSSIGSEIEEGFIKEQQGGWQWPAIYRGQDAQAAKAMWIGATDVVDDQGNTYDYRVVHVGPRVTGLGEFYPVEIKTVSRFAPPEVYVDGLGSYGKNVNNDEVDPAMKADRAIVTEMNSLLGITLTRTAKQFSQQYHDNYHVIEYTLTNTGNTDDDAEIELPNETVNNVYLFLQNRMAPVKASRYTVGNPSGWGVNTMIDRRGDGTQPGEVEDFRAHFAWHGLFATYKPTGAPSDFDNIGGPIWVPNTSGGWLDASDTTGALVAYHFVGSVTLHADKSATDKSDDINQPSTMSQSDSDGLLSRNNSPFDPLKMEAEYNLMSEGRTPRQAFKIEPSGLPGFLDPTKDPSTGATAGGWSYNTGYGPYTLAPGESVTIVIAEGSAGIDKELANKTGADFKNGLISNLEKNQVVFQGRDSLFQTFERAIENYQSGYDIPEGPLPPTNVIVNSAGNGIEVTWDYDDESGIDGFEIYRASGRVDSTYRLVYTAEPGARFISDGDVARANDPGGYSEDTPTPVRGRDYYYYVVAKGTQNNDGTGNTPTGVSLRSNRYYSQTYDPARLLRQAGEAMSDIRVVPNPYNSNIDKSLLLDQNGNDRIAFYEIPGICKIDIYTEIGEPIKTIYHDNGSGDEEWDLRTEDRQRVASGIYIARITNQDENDPEYGRVVIRKIVIIL